MTPAVSPVVRNRVAFGKKELVKMTIRGLVAL